MSEIFYTDSDGNKKRETRSFSHPFEARIFVSELLLADCTDVFVITDCVVYDSDGNQIDYIFDDSDYQDAVIS